MSARFWDHWGQPRQPTTTPWRSSQEPPSDPSQLGEAARRLLDDPTLQLALERVQQKLIESWRNTAVGQIEEREAAYRLWWASEQLKTELRIMLGNARAAERQRAA